MSDKWFVLRCAANSTLKLVNALQGNGIDAWTPIRIITRRLPRRNSKAKKEISTLPTFVFMSDNSRPILDILRTTCYLPSFRYMKMLGMTVLVNDSEMEFMHRVSMDKTKVTTQPVGGMVRFRSGSFEGIEGIVTQSSDKECTVRIDGTNTLVKVPPFLLLKKHA